MFITEVERRVDEDWPVECSAFKGTIEYEVIPEGEEEPEQFFIDYDFKDEYDRRRRFITVYQKKTKPLARFVGSDYWSHSGNVLWAARQEGGRALIRDLNNLSDDMEDFRTVRFKSLVTGTRAPSCWSLVMREHAPSLLKVALARMGLGTS